jgi:hypothetical protein
MREIFTHWSLKRKINSRFCWHFSKNAVGIGCAKENPGIRLTESEILVEFANCPRTKKIKIEKLPTHEKHP